jgi:hypothetical protein
MIRSLTTDGPLYGPAQYQTQTDYRSGKLQITRNGQPIMECDDKAEARNMIAYLSGMTARRSVRPMSDPLPDMTTAEAIDLIYGKE